jgi:tetratricopeptide (TPR) repeat protein
MALIDNLIERNAPGVVLSTDPPWQVLGISNEPASRRRWRAWAAAERARRHQDYPACRQWLQTAANVKGGDDPTPLWRTEMLVTSGRLERAEREPAAAFDHLKAGWESWLGVWNAFQRGAQNPRQAVVGIWVNDMVGSLADKGDRIEPGSTQVMVAWMSERMIHQLHEVGCDVIDLAGQRGAIAVAQEVANTLLPLMSSMTEPPSRLLLTSRVRLYLGNAYQNVERTKDAIAAFEAAIADLAPIRGQGDVDVRIARLEFNRANGLLRLGRRSEAIAVYDRVMKTFRSHGDREAELRVRSAKQYALEHR